MALHSETSCTSREEDSIVKIFKNGHNFEPLRIPWHVGLSIYRGGFIFCGGSLISLNTILTAAHCVTVGSSYYVVVGETRKYEEYVYSPDNDNHMFITEIVTVHPNYDEDVSLDNDIALLEVKKDIQFNNEIQPICVMSQEMLSGGINNYMNYEPTDLMVSGWGATSYGGQASSDLLHVTVPVVTEAYCKSVYGNYITDNMWCAGTNEGGKDSCQGDSGGPAVFRWPGGQFILGGVVSFGYKCAEPGIPGVYARVTQYTDWIYQNTGVWSDVSARYLQ